MMKSKGRFREGVALVSVLTVFLMSCNAIQVKSDVSPTALGEKVAKKEENKREENKAKFIPIKIDRQIASPSEPQVQEDYKIGVDDVLGVSVFGEPELSKTQQVRPDGRISFPLIGDVMAHGRTPLELRDDITEKLSRYMVNPRVTVLILEYRSKKATILGEVRAPGLLRLSAKTPLLEAISLAGGITESADLQGAMLIRDGRIVPVSFYRLLRKGDMRENVILQPNDAILIPNNVDNKVFLVGEVNRPGILRIRDEMSILEAITAAGGITLAGKHKVILIRGGLGQPQMLEVDIKKILKEGDLSGNIDLARGDIIYVPKTFMTNVSTILAYVNSFLSSVVLLESGITLYPAAKSVLTTGHLPDIETDSISITRDDQGNVTETSTSKSRSRQK